jgi:hypothetical protein
VSQPFFGFVKSIAVSGWPPPSASLASTPVAAGTSSRSPSSRAKWSSPVVIGS